MTLKNDVEGMTLQLSLDGDTLHPDAFANVMVHMNHPDCEASCEQAAFVAGHERDLER